MGSKKETGGESKPPKKLHVVTIKLKYPVEFGEDLIEEIELRRPRAADIEHLSAKPNMKELMQVGQKISGHPPAVFKRLDSLDAIAVVEEVGNFLSGGQKTGDNAW